MSSPCCISLPPPELPGLLREDGGAARGIVARTAAAASPTTKRKVLLFMGLSPVRGEVPLSLCPESTPVFFIRHIRGATGRRSPLRDPQTGDAPPEGDRLHPDTAALHFF